MRRAAHERAAHERAMTRDDDEDDDDAMRDDESLMAALERRRSTASDEDARGGIGGFDGFDDDGASTSTAARADAAVEAYGMMVETPPNESASKRAAARRRLRRLFNVPEDETLVADYMCALHSKILLQGKMYVFENYVCFYSNVFGYMKKRTIPFSRITLINRAKTAMVFPNAIEITYDGKTDFFTSFIFPEKSFNVICHEWVRASHYGKLNAMNVKRLSKLYDNEDHDKDVVEDAAEDSPRDVATARRSSEESEQSTPEHLNVEQKIQEIENDDDDDDDDGVGAEDIVGDFGNIPLARLPGKAPSDSPSLINLYSGDVDCSVEDFFLVAWSNKSRHDVQPKISQALEQTQVKITDWFEKRAIGCVREMVVTVPVRQTFGPKSTRCHQTQSYAVYDDNVFVLNTSQVQTDIPYGDYFRVEARWVLRPLGPKKCALSVGTEVIFTKSTMMKGLIVSSVIDESKVQVAKMIEIYMRKINPKQKVARAPSDVPEFVDVSKLRIPDASRDAVWSMLVATKNFVQQTSAAPEIDLKKASPWRKTCFFCSRAARIVLIIVCVLLFHTALSMSTEFVFGGVAERIFGWHPTRVYDEARYWEAKSKILNNELVYLERRLGYLIDEIEVAKAAMASAAK